MAAELPQGDFADEGSAPISAINVTPFVDVVLVLLVIFMITAPAMMRETLGIRLPKASSTEGAQPQTLAIAINEQGQILLNGKLSSSEELQLEAESAIKANPSVQALIAADENSKHSALVSVVDALKTVGLERFAIQVARPERKPESQR
jgi:biopolymer transport protein TolR